MRRAPHALLALALLAGAASAQPRPAGCPAAAAETRVRVPTLRVRSLMPAMRAWEDAARDADAPARAAAFRRLVVDAHPDLYGPVLAVPDSAGLARYVEWVAPRLAAAHRVAAHVEATRRGRAAAARPGGDPPPPARDALTRRTARRRSAVRDQ
jgi:hypothetical protein